MFRQFMCIATIAVVAADKDSALEGPSSPNPWIHFDGPTGPDGPTGAADPGGFAVTWKQDPGTDEWVKYNTARAYCPNLNRNQCKGKGDLGNGIDASVECKWFKGECTYVVNHCEDNTKKTNCVDFVDLDGKTCKWTTKSGCMVAPEPKDICSTAMTKGKCLKKEAAGCKWKNKMCYGQQDNDKNPADSCSTPISNKPPAGHNPCAGTKPKAGFDNKACFEADVEDQAGADVTRVAAVGEQAGANVTAGYVGNLETDAVPITVPYFKAGLCPVNVHWHLGSEHFSAGQYDEHGTGPSSSHRRHRKASGESVRRGYQCNLYDSHDSKFTQPFDWKHCKGMEVGQTYEVHWPHSKGGACGTVNQYQTPFYDGVFCNGAELAPTTYEAIGVQAQVFTIVNDESYYFPDLMRGMIVDGTYGADMAYYTGSTTGTSRDNTICSAYTPITWQVDRTCQMVSASTFDKMCADMKSQRDDMSDDLHAHGSRELVADDLAANNQDNGGR